MGSLRPTRSRSHFVLGSWAWVVPAAVLVLCIHYISVGVGGALAFTDWSGSGKFHWIGLDNFVRAFTDPQGRTALTNTLALAIGFVAGTNLIGLGFALALNRTLKSRHILRVALFAPVVLSPLAVSYIWQFIFQFDGPLNDLLRAVGLSHLQRAWLGDPAAAPWTILIVMVWQSIGLCMIIYLAGLAGVPEELEDASQIDGAGLWTRFRHITLPLIQPSVVIATVLTLVQGLRVFDQVIALTGGGPSGATETLATLVYKQTFTYGRFGYGAALSILLTLLVAGLASIQLIATRRRGN